MKLLYYFIPLVIVSVYSCEKDKVIESGKNSERISEIIRDASGKNRTVFFYDEEKLFLRNYLKESADGKWDLLSSEEFSYSENTITTIKYRNAQGNGQWREHEKLIYNYEDELINKLTAYYYENELWLKSAEIHYTYSGTNLIEYLYLSDINEDGGFRRLYRHEFIYENEKVLRRIGSSKYYTQDWVMEEKTEYTYANDDLTTSKMYFVNDSNNWEQAYYKSYSYTDGQLTTVTNNRLNKSEGKWIQEDSIYYQYNNNGYLIEETDLSGNQTFYKYEKGHGNARLFYIDPSYIDAEKPSFKNTFLVQ